MLTCTGQDSPFHRSLKRRQRVNLFLSQETSPLSYPPEMKHFWGCQKSTISQHHSSGRVVSEPEPRISPSHLKARNHIRNFKLMSNLFYGGRTFLNHKDRKLPATTTNTIFRIRIYKALLKKLKSPFLSFFCFFFSFFLISFLFFLFCSFLANFFCFFI